MFIAETAVSLTLGTILDVTTTIARQTQQGVELGPILQAAITAVRTHLDADRVLLYRFLADQDAVIDFESVGPEWDALLGQLIYDPCLAATWLTRYRQGDTTQITDVHAGEVAPCYVALLDRCQVQANVVVPILRGEALWGLLIVHQCRGPRQWQPLEVQFLQQVALHLGIAIQQASQRQRLILGNPPWPACDRCQAEIERLVSQSQFKALVTNMPGMVYRYFPATPDHPHQFTFVSAQAQDLLGVSPATLLTDADAFTQLIYPEDRASFFASVAHAAEHFLPWHWEGRITTLSGQQKWIQGHSQAQLTPEGAAWDGLLLDISDRKQAELDLREMSQALAHAVEGISHLDPQGRYLSVNQAYADMVGYAPKDLIGMDWQVTVYPEDRTHLQAAYSQMLAEGRVALEARGLRRDGSLFYQQLVLVATYGEQHQITGHYCFMKDVTTLKQAHLALQQQAEREHLLIAIAQRIRQTLELDEILRTTVTEVQQFLQTDRVLIYRFNPDWSGIVITEAIAPGWSSILSKQITDTYFVQTQGREYQLGHVKATADIYAANFDPCHVEFLEQMQVKAILVVPILQEDKLWGLLVAHHCRSPRQWQPLETELLQQLATQIAIAIQQSELYAQVQRLNAVLEVQVQERTAQLQQSLDFEATLKRITDQVRDSLDERHILRSVVRELTIATHADGCNTTSYNADHTIALVEYEYHEGEAVITKTDDQISHSSDPHLYQQLFQGQYCHFCWIDKTVIHPEKDHKSILTCPIVDDQGILGDLWLFKAAQETFNELEIRLVQQVANQCAIALRQSRLYQSAQAQVRELERLNQLKDDFLSTVSHELRTPMSNIKMATQMLEISLKTLGIFDDKKSAIARYFAVLSEEGQREINLINDLLDLTRLDADMESEPKHTISLQCFIPYLAEAFMERLNQQQQTLKIHIADHLPTLTTNASYLERIITELLNNACKYTPAGETITIAAHPIATGLELQISNSGVEIPPAECERIFDKFYRIPKNDPWKHGGTGLGLTLVKKLMEHLGGKISVNSHDRQFSLYLQFPL